MKNYEWYTIDGRFRAARDISKLEYAGNTKDAEELRQLLGEAIAAYNPPEYFAFSDKKNKLLILLYGKSGFVDSNEFDKFICAHLDNYICHVNAESTWMSGMLCQQCEPIITTKSVERWNVFETEDGQLWFEQM